VEVGETPILTRRYMHIYLEGYTLDT
jgi:hypothetical protein